LAIRIRIFDAAFSGIIGLGTGMAEYGDTVIYEELNEGGYQVIVPALPGIVTYGRTVAEAREMARDAIVCHIRGLIGDD
jgi:predicted RNase H-like HicB family nuclease